MSRDTSIEQVQAEYERLRAEQPTLSHKELWHRAQQAAVDNPDAVVDMRFVSSGGLSLRAVVGVALVCIATASGAVLIVWVDPTNPAAVLLPLMVLLLGVGFAVLVSAQKQITRSSGAVAGQDLVGVGFLVAAVGILALAALFLYSAVGIGL